MIVLLALKLLSAVDLSAAPAKSVRLSADTLDVVGPKRQAIYRGHAKAERDSTTIAADQFVVQLSADQQIETIDATGNVTAIDGTRSAWGDAATYDNRTGILIVTGNPRAQEGLRQVTGDEMTFTTGSDQLVVKNAKTLTDDAKAPTDKKQLSVESDVLTIDKQRSTALWRGHVRARRGAMLLRAPVLNATYNASGEIDRASASGGVEATEGDRWAKGKQAEYDVAKGVLVVTGNPEARQGNNRMKGTRITFYSGTEFTEVENATTIVEPDPARGSRP